MAEDTSLGTPALLVAGEVLRPLLRRWQASPLPGQA